MSSFSLVRDCFLGYPFPRGFPWGWRGRASGGVATPNFTQRRQRAAGASAEDGLRRTGRLLRKQLEFPGNSRLFRGCARVAACKATFLNAESRACSSAECGMGSAELRTPRSELRTLEIPHHPSPVILSVPDTHAFSVVVPESRRARIPHHPSLTNHEPTP